MPVQNESANSRYLTKINIMPPTANMAEIFVLYNDQFFIDIINATTEQPIGNKLTINHNNGILLSKSSHSTKGMLFISQSKGKYSTNARTANFREGLCIFLNTNDSPRLALY